VAVLKLELTLDMLALMLMLMLMLKPMRARSLLLEVIATHELCGPLYTGQL
jgi:hypothetical protein